MRCEAIVQSDEFQELVRTETILINDPDAQDLIKRFNHLQANLENLFRQGKRASAQEFSELQKLEEELLDNPEYINENPYEKGWIAELKLTDFESDKELLLDGDVRQAKVRICRALLL